MTDLDDLMGLTDAAKSLGIAEVTLRNQAVRGRLRAVRKGGSWITTKDEVERYRREHLGRVGRPAKR